MLNSFTVEVQLSCSSWRASNFSTKDLCSCLRVSTPLIEEREDCWTEIKSLISERWTAKFSRKYEFSLDNRSLASFTVAISFSRYFNLFSIIVGIVSFSCSSFAFSLSSTNFSSLSSKASLFSALADFTRSHICFPPCSCLRYNSFTIFERDRLNLLTAACN